MRVEWISTNQFKIFLTFDDLIERGFTKDDLWNDISSVRDLFTDMMDEASEELDFELEGVLFVQVHMMQAQGMHIHVTKKSEKEEESDSNDDFVDMKVTLDESENLIFLFNQFEDLIQASSTLSKYNIDGGQIYSFEGTYYLYLENETINLLNKENIIAILSEYGLPSIISIHRLKEYGKKIMSSNALAKIKKYFN